MSKKVLLNSKEIGIILHRLACQLIENHNDFSNTVLIGLQPRGIYLAKRLAQILEEDYKVENLQLGLLDITFYRDDFRRREAPLEATNTQIDFLDLLQNRDDDNQPGALHFPKPAQLENDTALVLTQHFD